MLKRLIVLLLVTQAAQAAPSVGERIVGGSETNVGEIPWQVAVISTSNSLICSGSVISENWVLTAAGCTDTKGVNTSNYIIRSGSLSYNESGSLHSVTEIHNHPKYVAGDLGFDISLWKVNPPFNLALIMTSAVELPPQGSGSVDPGTILTIAGWGRSEYGSGQPSSVLLQVDVPVVGNAICSTNYANQGGLQADEFCAGGDGKGSCFGDGGGALCQDGVQFGVDVRGDPDGCGNVRLPSIYTEVSQYRTWITFVTGV